MMFYRDFNALGFRVFGLHQIVGGNKCACGNEDCKAAGKHPVTSGWLHTPIWDDEQLDTMELSEQVETGYGVLCKGLLVIDVDARNGGVSSFERLRYDFPEVEKAGLIVNTGSGGGSKHLYFTIQTDIALVPHHNDYPGIDFRSGPAFVVGPGSLHASGARYEVAYGSPDDIDAAPSELVALLTKPERHRAELGDGTSMDVSHADLVEMLAHVEPDSDHETWVRCGMAVHHASGGTAFAVWDDWSNKGAKYPGRESLSKRWHSFGKSTNPVTLGTLTHYAEAGGWRASVTFETEIDFPIEPTTLDITNVNLKRPPGFVGEVAAWIEDQSYRPREHLAVAGALTSIGNIVGLRYTDDLNGVTTNLFTFCVAGSGTGKEPIQQAAAAVMKAARIQQAVHGSIKSEQEIVRNLVDHQAAMFLIDEIGIFLKKVKNAQAKGGASYLDGVIGALMSAYSKANGFMLLTGDMKKEIRKGLKQELMQLEKQENPSPAILSRIGAVRRSMETLDFGLDRPFLSLCGFTTPETFDELVDFYNATNGFIGRSLLFTERDTTPPRKRGFRPRPMPPLLKQALENLYAAGSFDMTGSGRVEYYDERIKIPSTPGAVALMEQASDSFEAMAEDAKSTTGLEALAMRAYEQVAKVSLILAVPGGVRTEEHVLWAYALVRRDIREKMDLVTSNDRAKDSPLIAMRAKIMNLTSGDEGETFGVLVNRMRKYKKADVQKCLDQMVGAGLITATEGTHRFKGTIVKRYKAAG